MSETALRGLVAQRPATEGREFVAGSACMRSDRFERDQQADNDAYDGNGAAKLRKEPRSTASRRSHSTDGLGCFDDDVRTCNIVFGIFNIPQNTR